MRRFLWSALRMMIVMTIVTGVAYPLVITGIAQSVFHHQANGSLVTYRGRDIGSSLLGQRFENAKGQPLVRYFQPRPSAAGAGYDALASGASNVGPSNPTLVHDVATLERAYRSFNDVSAAVRVPSDAVTTSASGLDPDISIANALLQAPRVENARGVAPSIVQSLIERATQGRVVGILGEPVVNVLELNLSLDQLAQG